MQYTIDFDINSFEFWSGAAARIASATPDQICAVAYRIEDVFAGCAPTKTDINDFVWFECDDIFYPEDEDGE